MSELPSALQTLIKDPDAQRAGEELGSIIERMRADGAQPQAIYRALAKTLMDLTKEEYFRWHAHRLVAKKFMKEIGAAFLRKADAITLPDDPFEPWGPELTPSLDFFKERPEDRDAFNEFNVCISSLKQKEISAQAICRSIAKLIMKFCDEEYDQRGSYRLWAKKFVKEVGEGFESKVGLLETHEEGLYWERKITAEITKGSC